MIKPKQKKDKTKQNKIIEAVIIEVNELADTDRTSVQVPRDPLDLERNTMMGANLKSN